MKPTKCQQPLKFVIVLKATRIQFIFKRSPTILIIWSRFLKLSIACVTFVDLMLYSTYRWVRLVSLLNTLLGSWVILLLDKSLKKQSRKFSSRKKKKYIYIYIYIYNNDKKVMAIIMNNNNKKNNDNNNDNNNNNNLYIGLFLFCNEGRGVSFVTNGIVDSVLMN